MRAGRKVLLMSLFVLSAVIFDVSVAGAVITNTQSHYTVRDELFNNYSTSDMKDLVRKLHDKMRNLRENARKKFSNLMPNQGKSRSIASAAREQRAKVKDQQAASKRMQEDRLRDIRQKIQDLNRLRADSKHRNELSRR